MDCLLARKFTDEGIWVMRRHWNQIAVVAIALIALIVPTAANAAEETGSTARWPWSGYWWPMLDTQKNLYDTGGPMSKYDAYLKATTGVSGGAAAWEASNHATSNSSNSWWGHCHAWASAAILTTEPAANITKGGVAFNTNDTKGLITELYYSPTYNWLSGTRVDDAGDTSSAAYRDIAPVWMDYLLRYYVRYYRYPFIMDISADSQVWNYPVFAFRRNTTDLANGSQNVVTTVWFSSPDYNVTGTRYISRTYTYTLTPGQYGVWTGNSVKDHPDFAWVPTGKSPMAHVSETKVEEILGQNV
jgi:hypothetical protein